LNGAYSANARESLDHDAGVECAFLSGNRTCCRNVHAEGVQERWTMKKTFFYAAAIVSLLLPAIAVYAQEPAPQGGGQWGRGQMPTVDQRLQRMTQALDLSEDQQQKIKPILENESTQMQGLHADTSLSQEDRMAKMKQIRENTSTQISPILNADQQKKYAEMMSHMGRGRGPGGPNQSAPPPQQ
jgi:hypothetical protein